MARVHRTEQIADFVAESGPADLTERIRSEMKLSVLDSLGCAVGSLRDPLLVSLRRYVDNLGGSPQATLVGGGKTSMPLVGFYNAALVRYLDFSDTYSNRDEGSHPSDALGPILAACEYAGRSGTEFLHCLAISYEIQGRLIDAKSIRDRGFDQPTFLVYAIVGGVARALGLDRQQTAHALAMGGTACNALRVTRTGELSNWKGLATPFCAQIAVHAVLMAQAGVTGPLAVFEGTRGLMDVIGRFSVDWSDPSLEHILSRTIKRYNAEGNAQTAVEAALLLRDQHKVDPGQIERIDVRTFEAAVTIIGGGIEGDKRIVATKEQADHSLPYIVAVTLLDGEISSRQYTPARIASHDVQALLRKVHVSEDPSFTARFPPERPTAIRITTVDGNETSVEVSDCLGGPLKPFTWTDTRGKYDDLTRGEIDSVAADDLAQLVERLDALDDVGVLADKLGAI